ADPGVKTYTEEVVRLLGGTVFDLAAASPGEGVGAAWRGTLETTKPTAVFVQEMDGASPALLMDLRERGIPYAIFLHDFTPLCPTHRLWHRRQERCSGPGRTGWKCAWCVSGSWGRAAELPLRTLLYRHRPQDWRTGLIRAEALVASSRFARDFWVEQGAPPERVAVIAPVAELPATPAGSAIGHARPRLLLAGGGDSGAGAELLAEALELLREPVEVLAPVAPGTGVGCDVVVVPARWETPSARCVLQAQLAGIPAVATAVGGLTESIIHGVNGYLAAPDDAATLAQAVREALVRLPPAWGGDRVAANARAEVEKTRRQLHRLFELLFSGSADPALTLEHEEWLAGAAGAHGLSPAEVAQRLIAEMRHPNPDVNPTDPLGAAIAARARSGSRARQLDLNHAIAFFRACGCHRIAPLPESAPMAADAVDSLRAWGLQSVETGLADGLFTEVEDESGIMRARLRRRFPSLRAVVAISGRGVETQSLAGPGD
ncbi:MAG: glycosyltransferase, partial [Terriglobales bacterium]